MSSPWPLRSHVTIEVHREACSIWLPPLDKSDFPRFEALHIRPVFEGNLLGFLDDVQLARSHIFSIWILSWLGRRWSFGDRAVTPKWSVGLAYAQFSKRRRIRINLSILRHCRFWLNISFLARVVPCSARLFGDCAENPSLFAGVAPCCAEVAPGRSLLSREYTAIGVRLLSRRSWRGLTGLTGLTGDVVAGDNDAILFSASYL